MLGGYIACVLSTFQELQQHSNTKSPTIFKTRNSSNMSNQVLDTYSCGHKLGPDELRPCGHPPNSCLCKYDRRILRLCDECEKLVSQHEEEKRRDEGLEEMQKEGEKFEKLGEREAKEESHNRRDRSEREMRRGYSR
jgi:hypothetical protein